MAATQVVRSEKFPDLGDEVLFPRLSDAKLEWLAKRGERLYYFLAGSKRRKEN